MRDSECSSLGSSSQDSDRGSGGGCITGVTSAADHQMAVTVLPPSKPNAQIGNKKLNISQGKCHQLIVNYFVGIYRSVEQLYHPVDAALQHKERGA